VTAEDPFNNTVTTYAGLVQFTSSDPNSNTSLPGNHSLTAGVGTFSATLLTVGSQTITATDTNTATITGKAAITINAGAVTHFAVVAPSPQTAGVAFNFQVTAEDQFNNVVSAYSGSLAFSSSDSSAGLPAPSPMPAGGTGFFSATLFKAPGPQTIGVVDTVNSGLTGLSNPITVVAANATHLVFVGPGPVTAGNPAVFSVVAEDPYGNTATGYNGTETFSSTDHGLSTSLPPNNSSLTNGVGIFTATLTTAGTQTITAMDTSASSITGNSGPIAVTSSTTTHLVLTLPFSHQAVAGNPFALIVQAEDKFNNQVLTYNGTVAFISSDTQATLPASTTLTTGWGVFAATLRTAGTQTLTAADSVSLAISSSSGTMVVSPGPATHFMVSPMLAVYPLIPAPGIAVTGSGYNISVAALDSWNNTATGYTGTATLFTSDTAASYSGPHALSGGVGTFSATFNTSGNQSVTATDTAAPSITGTSAVAVRDLVVTNLVQNPDGFTASFSKPFANPTGPNALNLYDSGFTNYGPADVTLTGPLGSVRGSLLLSPDNTSITFVKTSKFVLTRAFNPASGLLAVTESNSGTDTPSTGTYTVTLRSATNAFTDTLGVLLDGNNTGAPGSNFQATFAVGAAPVVVGLPAFARGPTNFTGPQDSFNNIELPNNTGNQVSVSNGIPINLSNGTGVTSGSFTLLYDSNLLNITGGEVNNQQTIRFGSGATGGDFELSFNSNTTGPITYTTVATDLQSNISTALNGLSSISTVGGVQVMAISATNVVVNFNNTSLAVQSTMGSANNNLTPAATITITGSTLPVGSTFSVATNTAVATASTATISFSSPSPLAGPAAVNLGTLTARVPVANTASYGAKQLLHFMSESLSNSVGASIPVTNADAVQVIAFLGDASGDGVYSPLDAALLSRVAVGIDSGFAAYARTDPVIIGDIVTAGSVNSADATLMNQYLAGQFVAQMPIYPTGLTTNPAGPDPTLSVVPVSSSASAGSTITVPVNIDTAKPDGSSGMMEAVLGLRYDPQVFTVTSDDIQLGSVPESGSGWHLTSVVNPLTGQIGIDLYSTSPIQSAAGGSLVTLALHVREGAPAGTTALSLVPQVSPTGNHVYDTEVADAQGAFVLHSYSTAAGLMPAQPADLTVIGQAPAASELAAVGQLPPATASVSELVGPAASLSLQAATAPSVANALPVSLVEQVFGNLEETAQVVEETSFAQPGPLLSWENGERTPANVRDLALLQGQTWGFQRDWMSQDSPAYLAQTARGLTGGVPALVDGAALGHDDEADELAGLDAFFARQAGEGRN
jgi:hypothetical protein